MNRFSTLRDDSFLQVLPTPATADYISPPPPPEPIVVDFNEPIEVFQNPQERHPEQALIKRVVEITVAVIVLGLSSPIFWMMSSLNKRYHIDHDTLIRQSFLGQNQKMIHVATFALFQPEYRDESPLLQTLERLGVGHLPKWLNVLEGTLSIVGPRPITPKEAEALEDTQWNRFVVAPGLIGLEQLLNKFNHACPIPLMAEMDLDYIRRWNGFLDLAIMWQYFTSPNPHLKKEKQAKSVNDSPRRIQITVTY